MKHNHTKGFTLVEMMISLTLLSMITVIGYQGLQFSARQWQRGNDSMRFQYDYFQAVSWIRNKIGASENVMMPGSSDYSYFFTGSSDSVEFVARFNRTRRGGLYVNKIFHHENDNKIYVSYYLHHPGINGKAINALPEQVALLSNVKSIRFSYYGRKQGRNAYWHDNWGDLNSIPRLIRVDIENDTGEHYQSTIQVLTSNNA
jgi:general secretion pathway protein J